MHPLLEEHGAAGVRHDSHALAVLPEVADHRDDLGQHHRPANILSVQRRDVEVEALAPGLDAVPTEGASRFGLEGGDVLHDDRERDVVRGCDGAREFLEPEPVVESQVEKCAVHVEQHIINVRKVHDCSCAARWTARLYPVREVKSKKLLIYF